MEKEYNINELVNKLDFTSNHLIDCGNIMLTNKEIEVLTKYNIDYKNCSSLKELLYKIETLLNEEECFDWEELDFISSSIAERDYYQNTNK